MNTPNATLVNNFFLAIEAKDIDSVMALLTEDAEFIDPHYPNVHMKGKKEIFDGFTWGFNGLKKLGFTIDKCFESEDGGIAVEVATAHVLPNGKKLNFPQVFIFDVNNGKVSRAQAYEPYGPHGAVGIMLMVTRLINKFKNKA